MSEINIAAVTREVFQEVLDSNNDHVDGTIVIVEAQRRLRGDAVDLDGLSPTEALVRMQAKIDHLEATVDAMSYTAISAHVKREFDRRGTKNYTLNFLEDEAAGNILITTGDNQGVLLDASVYDDQAAQDAIWDENFRRQEAAYRRNKREMRRLMNQTKKDPTRPAKFFRDQYRKKNRRQVTKQ